MVTVRKANKVIRVIENELDKYLTKGYKIVDKPVEKPAPTVEAKPESKMPQFAKVYKAPIAEKTVADEQPKTSRKRKR